MSEVAESEFSIRAVSWAEAESLSGLRLDRRRRYAWGTLMSGGVGLLELVSWVASCSGCCELGEYGSGAENYPTDPKHGCLVGAGCDECGYTGKRRDAMWVDHSAVRTLRESA